MTAVRAAAVVLADVEAAVRTVQGQVAAAEALPRVARIRIWKKRDAFRRFSSSTAARRGATGSRNEMPNAMHTLQQQWEDL